MIARLFLVLVAGLVLAGCGGSSSNGNAGETETAGGPTLAAPGEGVLIISNLSEIQQRDLKSGATTTILATDDPSSFVLDAVASRDGGRIAYVLQPPAKVIDGRFDAGSDLWVMNRDGSDPHAVFEHKDANQLVRFPRWEDDEHVLAIVTEVTTEGGVTRVLYTLQRITLATGARERVLENVLSFDVSPDDQRLAYSRFMPDTGEVLEASDFAGSEEVTLVGPEQLLQPFGYPRYSPDGATVAFASADQTGATLPTRYISLQRGQSGQFEPAAAETTFDGLPQDIWTVDSTGSRAVRMAYLKEDLPSLTWDGSGQRIYVIGVNGLYSINVQSGFVERMAEGAFHAQISWAPGN